MGDNARRLRLLVTPNNVKEKLRTAHSFLQRLRFLTEDVSVISGWGGTIGEGRGVCSE